MGWSALSKSYSNVARSLAVVGDRWTLLIMREVRLGVRRFEEIQAQTGMSSHLLANRLKTLEADELLERRVYKARPLRHEYYATAKGRDLDNVILALRNWDLRWGGSDGIGGSSATLIDKATGNVIGGHWSATSGQTFSFDDVDTVLSLAWAQEREQRVARFHSAKKSKLVKQ